jgi:hypothetical protein
MRSNCVGDAFTFGGVLSFVISYALSNRIITVETNLNLNNHSPTQKNIAYLE